MSLGGHWKFAGGMFPPPPGPTPVATPLGIPRAKPPIMKEAFVYTVMGKILTGDEMTNKILGGGGIASTHKIDTPDFIRHTTVAYPGPVTLNSMILNVLVCFLFLKTSILSYKKHKNKTQRAPPQKKNLLSYPSLPHPTPKSMDANC